MIREKTLEYRRFTGTRGARYHDWTIGSGRYQVKSSISMDFAGQFCIQNGRPYLKEPLWSSEVDKKESYRVRALYAVRRSESKAFGWI